MHIDIHMSATYEGVMRRMHNTWLFGLALWCIISKLDELFCYWIDISFFLRGKTYDVLCLSIISMQFLDVQHPWPHFQVWQVWLFECRGHNLLDAKERKVWGLTIFILFIEDEEVLSKFFFNVTFFVIYGENYWGSMQQIPSLQFLHTRQ